MSKGKSHKLKLKQPTESVHELHNPGCGWYRMYRLRLEERVAEERLRYCMTEPLVMLFVHIGAYRDRVIDGEALSHLREAFDILREAGKDVILRIAYDDVGKGMESEPDRFAKVLSHIGQLAPVLREYSSMIQVFQGLMVGSWGEMHDSRYLGKGQLTELYDALHIALGEEVPIALRRPVYCRRIGREAGIFNDGIIGSESDLGTFGELPREQVGWEGAWSRKEETAYMQQLAWMAPCGGETVWGDYLEYPYTAEQTVRMLSDLRISYLNRDYHPQILTQWQRMIGFGRGLWKGMDLRSYIGRHLGYRFRVTRVREISSIHYGEGMIPNVRDKSDVPQAGKLPIAPLKRACFLLAVTVMNDGFARCYDALEVCVELQPEGQSQRNPFLRDAGSEAQPEQARLFPASGVLEALAPGKSIELLFRIPKNVTGRLYLCARRKKDGQTIRFANEGGDARVVLGEIK